MNDSIPLEPPTSTSGCSISNRNSSVKGWGLFLDNNTLPHYLINAVSPNNNTHYCSTRRTPAGGVFRRKNGVSGGGFLSVSLSVKGSSDGIDRNSTTQFMAAAVVGGGGGGGVVEEKKKKVHIRLRGKPAAMNTTKHLWAGAVAAMVSRFVYDRIFIEF